MNDRDYQIIERTLISPIEKSMSYQERRAIERTLISPIEKSMSYQERRAIERTLISPKEPQTLSKRDREFIEKTLK